MKVEDKIAKIQNIVVILATIKRAYEIDRQRSFDTHPNITDAELHSLATINNTIDLLGEHIKEIRIKEIRKGKMEK